METTIMENQMEKKMENEMETGIIRYPKPYLEILIINVNSRDVRRERSLVSSGDLRGDPKP